MSANVETMFSVREDPWHGLGEIVQEAPTSQEAIKLAGLNWTVEQHPVFAHMDKYQVLVPDTLANIRSDNHETLGVVGNRYKIVQNIDAFDFAIWQANYPYPLPPEPTPEPTTLGMLLIGDLAMLRRRR